MRKVLPCLTDQRGIALPMALLALLILSVLIIAFLQLGTAEPVIANNQAQIAQARAIAEAGIERAAWALYAGDPLAPDAPDLTNGIQTPIVGQTAPAPYDLSVSFPVLKNGSNGPQVGIYRVRVSNGAAPDERVVEAEGWVPTYQGPTAAHQRIKVTLIKLQTLLNPPAALSVRGELQVSGNSLIDSGGGGSALAQGGAGTDSRCPGRKAGSLSLGQTAVQGNAADVYNYGSTAPNLTSGTYDASSPTAIVQNLQSTQDQGQSIFNSFTLSNDQLTALKAYAKQNGTYYQGSVTFSAGNQMPNGIVFVDTVNGCNIDDPNCPVSNVPTPTSNFASVDIHGNAPASADGIFHGWLIVNGSLSISGDFQMWGMGYVLNDLSYTGTGTGQGVGAMVTQNIRDTSATSIDTNTGGQSKIIFNCDKAVSGGGSISPMWTLKPDTYAEVSD